jgi:hypothetical protein
MTPCHIASDRAMVICNSSIRADTSDPSGGNDHDNQHVLFYEFDGRNRSGSRKLFSAPHSANIAKLSACASTVEYVHAQRRRFGLAPRINDNLGVRD